MLCDAAGESNPLCEMKISNDTRNAHQNFMQPRYIHYFDLIKHKRTIDVTREVSSICVKSDELKIDETALR